MHTDTDTHKHIMQCLNHIHQQEISIFSWPFLSKSPLILLSLHHFPDTPPLLLKSYTKFFNSSLFRHNQACLNTTVSTNEQRYTVLIYATCLTYANTTTVHHPINGVEKCLFKIYTVNLLTPQAVLPWKQDAKVDGNTKK